MVSGFVELTAGDISKLIAGCSENQDKMTPVHNRILSKIIMTLPEARITYWKNLT